MAVISKAAISMGQSARQFDLDAKHPTIGLSRKFLMKRRECMGIPLTDALRPVWPSCRKFGQSRQSCPSSNSTNGEATTVGRMPHAKLSTLRNPRR
jgi:hypothetical protein